jgi:hypothetical protein
MKILILLTFIFTGFYGHSLAQDSIKNNTRGKLNFSGQLSSWGLYNDANDLPVYLGARYIPTMNYTLKIQDNRQFDVEVSVNTLGMLGMRPFDRTHTDGNINPYRAWARYSTQHLEIRAGLQKINFGSATLLRPLMWFDQLDPRDPLQLTNGVWGVLGRYYFMNNANLWLWTLYGNNKPRPWDLDKSNQNYPEYGGRFQSPVPRGEVALTFHHRVSDSRGLEVAIPSYPAVAENRIGLDGKWDLGVGLWFEGTYINKTKEMGIYTNTEILNVGTDNTFGIGNGLNVVFEQLLFSYDQNAFAFSRSVSFTGLSLSYPINLTDHLNVISFFDWTTSSAYNFLNLKRQFNKIAFYIMAFWNPSKYNLPQQINQGNYYSGKGFQLMLVYNH